MFRSLRRLDLENDVKNQLEEHETDVSVLEKRDKERHMLYAIWQRKHRQLGHVLRNDVLP